MMKKPIRLLTICFLYLGILPVTAQTDYELICRLETVGVTGAGQHAPFWHTSNRQGLPNVDKSNGYMHLAAIGNVNMPCGLDVDYGLDFGGGAGLQSNLFVHQLFCDVDYKWLGLSMGMKERWNDKNRYLSTGAMAWSGNCRPVPEFRAGIPEFVRMSILGNWFSIKGHIGFGRFTDDKWRRDYGAEGYVEGVLFHSKSAFLRIGDQERFPLQFTFGLEMNNMFGGVDHEGDLVLKMPSDAATYWKVLFPFHEPENQGTWDGDNFGSWHINFDYFWSDWRIGVYYEHFYEDHSSMLGIEYKNNTEGDKGFIDFGFRRNWFDGLYGIELNAPDDIRFLRNIVFEYMNTRGQSGPVRHSATDNVDGMYVIEEVDGRDDIYNHTIYISDTHWGYSLGNPVLISPVYNADNSNHFRSNRVQMFHAGINGSITDNIDYRFMATTTRHWGRYGAPLRDVERVSSLMLECSYRLGDSYGWKFTLSGAMDIDSGDLIGNNKGVMLTVSKTWKVI